MLINSFSTRTIHSGFHSNLILLISQLRQICSILYLKSHFVSFIVLTQPAIMFVHCLSSLLDYKLLEGRVSVFFIQHLNEVLFLVHSTNYMEPFLCADTDMVNKEYSINKMILLSKCSNFSWRVIEINH